MTMQVNGFCCAKLRLTAQLASQAHLFPILTLVLMIVLGQLPLCCAAQAHFARKRAQRKRLTTLARFLPAAKDRTVFDVHFYKLSLRLHGAAQEQQQHL